LEEGDVLFFDAAVDEAGGLESKAGRAEGSMVRVGLGRGNWR
jgi:hypothetical protein